MAAKSGRLRGNGKKIKIFEMDRWCLGQMIQYKQSYSPDKRKNSFMNCFTKVREEGESARYF